jgi:hypothetical protein
MKLIYCEKCGWLFQLIRNLTMHCACEDVKAGKYLDDSLTAVVTKNAIVVGIDNNSFRDSVHRYLKYNPEGDEPWSRRVDFFFTGWIPTIPGEVIKVDTKKEVEEFPQDFETNDEFSTMPVSADLGEADV